MQCNLFELDRKALLYDIANFNTLSETEQFTSIMSCENHTIIKTLAKYTYARSEKNSSLLTPEPMNLARSKGIS